MRIILGMLVVLTVMVAGTVTAQAASCYHLGDALVCIVDIKRSAKYYWEYRVTVTVDGVRQPTVRYNCRDRTRTQPDGTITPITDSDIGHIICRLVDRQSYRH
ncbi:MAG: hypothetical protein RML75_19260 [Cyanobacteriota bacterium SKYGB_h_bin112]|nr:hypothetical protein [Cyanobacteriota bacterium SKYGB_h_bin112]